MNCFKKIAYLGITFFMLTLLCTAAPSRLAAQSASEKHRFSAAAGSQPGSSVTPVPKASTSNKATDDRLHDDWLAATLAVLEDLYWWLKVAGFVVLWWGVSALFAIPLYRTGLPVSAYGAARWSLFWGALVCCLLSYISTFFTSWYWLDYWFLGGLFGLIMLILLFSALSQPATRKPA